MKQIFTLLTALALTAAFPSKASAQNINEGFNTSAEVTALATSCWNFNSVNFSTSFPITGAGSMISQLGVTSEIITPELIMPAASLTISFNYSTVNTAPGSRKLQIVILDGAIETKIYDNNISGTGIFSFTLLATDTHGDKLVGNKKIIIRISDNISLKLDNLAINAPYTYATGCPFENTPLPITLLSFQGSLSNNQAQLQWSVADNQTGDYFEIEKSIDGKKFSSVALVSTTQAQGNASYQYREPAQASAYYRLRIVNKDHTVSYSKVLMIRAQAEGSNQTLALFQNPVQQTLSFSFTSSATAPNEITVYNLVGARVHAEKLMAQKGKNSVSLTLNNNLPAGTYILEVKNNWERNTTKFIKQ